MKYDILIYAGNEMLVALDVDGDQKQYISMAGNNEHPAVDVNGFYEHLLDYYNVDDLSEIKAGIRIINGGADKKNIDFLLHKFSNVNDFSLWRVEELLPVILMNKNTLDKGKTYGVKVYDRSYVVGADEEFNVTVSYTDGADIVLSLDDFTLFNNFNGANFKQDTVLIEQMMVKIKKLDDDNQNYKSVIREYQYVIGELEKKIAVFEREKTSVLQEPDNNITEEKCSVGNVIELGLFEGKPIKWRILKRINNTVYVVSEEILCNRVFSENNSNNWENSDLKKWLNGEFYTLNFNEKEKSRIIKINDDNITLLTREESSTLLIKSTKDTNWWWLRSPVPRNANFVWNLFGNGYSNCEAINRGGVRPALYLSLN